MDDAAIESGIDPRTAYIWLARGRKERKGEYRLFFQEVEEARSRAKSMLVRRVVSRALTDPKMALEVLSRRFPAEWARQQKVQIEDKTVSPRRTGLREKIAANLDRIEARLAAQDAKGGQAR